MRAKDDKTKRGPHSNANHPVGTAAHAVQAAEHAPIKHRPTVPKSLRKKK